MITSPHVGDYSRLVDARRVGVVMEPDDPATWPCALDAVVALAREAEVRARCRSVGESLSWDHLAPRLRAALRAQHATPRASKRPASEPSRDA